MEHSTVEKFTPNLKNIRGAKATDYIPLAIGGVTLAAAVVNLFRRRSFRSFVGVVAPAIMVAGIYRKLNDGLSQNQTDLH